MNRLSLVAILVIAGLFSASSNLSAQELPDKPVMFTVTVKPAEDPEKPVTYEWKLVTVKTEAIVMPTTFEGKIVNDKNVEAFDKPITFIVTVKPAEAPDKPVTYEWKIVNDKDVEAKQPDNKVEE